MNSVAQNHLQKRLLLGVSPVDTVRQRDLDFPLRIEIERQLPHQSGLSTKQYSHLQYPVKSKVSGLTRHPGGRYSLHYYPGATDSVILRMYDLQRRYIPRRLQFPLLTLQQILAVELAQSADYLQSRSRIPGMYPGAAYPIQSRSTGLRGRVMQNGEEVRWTHIELTVAGDSSQVIARARGDDRGEFLLLLPPAAVPDATLNETATFDLRVWARATAATPVSPEVAVGDPFWDLPLEEVTDIQPNDNVSGGLVPPVGYVLSQTTQSIAFAMTQLQTSIDVGEINFNPP